MREKNGLVTRIQFIGYFRGGGYEAMFCYFCPLYAIQYGILRLPGHICQGENFQRMHKILLDELKGSNSHALMNGENDNSPCLGNDILGWDIGGFHSFLCNSLQKELPDVRFNGVGLLGNVFSEVEGFTRQIQGKGEPVEWIPCRIGMHGQNAESDRLTGGKWEKQGQREKQDSPHGQSAS